jgi:hypothetical protein
MAKHSSLLQYATITAVKSFRVKVPGLLFTKLPIKMNRKGLGTDFNIKVLLKTTKTKTLAPLTNIKLGFKCQAHSSFC